MDEATAWNLTMVLLFAYLAYLAFKHRDLVGL